MTISSKLSCQGMSVDLNQPQSMRAFAELVNWAHPNTRPEASCGQAGAMRGGCKGVSYFWSGVEASFDDTIQLEMKCSSGKMCETVHLVSRLGGECDPNLDLHDACVHLLRKHGTKLFFLETSMHSPITTVPGVKSKYSMIHVRKHASRAT